eukprot:2052768-Rhodomonas_salina.1
MTVFGSAPCSQHTESKHQRRVTKKGSKKKKTGEESHAKRKKARGKVEEAPLGGAEEPWAGSVGTG